MHFRPVYLLDAVTGQQMDLTQQGSYSFSASNAALITGRFSLSFGALRPLATNGGFTAASVSVYPNSAHQEFSVLIPAVSGAIQVEADLLNSLGQVVGHYTAALPAARCGHALHDGSQGVADGCVYPAPAGRGYHAGQARCSSMVSGWPHHGATYLFLYSSKSHEVFIPFNSTGRSNCGTYQSGS